MQGMGFIVIYIVFFAALIYFTSIRPQKKERQKQQEMLSSVAVGDPNAVSCDRSGREARDKIRLVFYKENEH